MNTSESADELVKIYLEGVETVLRISGTGAKNIAMALIAMSKERTQTKGKTRLTNMLKSGKSLDIFTIKAEDLKKFSQEAKKYGILYCALANKRNNKIDGMVDIMVREDIQGVAQTIMDTAGLGEATQTTLPQEMITAIESCGFFESIPLWAVTLIRRTYSNNSIIYYDINRLW